MVKEKEFLKLYLSPYDELDEFFPKVYNNIKYKTTEYFPIYSAPAQSLLQK